MPRTLIALFAAFLSLIAPAHALDALQSSSVPGRIPSALCATVPGGLAINRADGTLSYCDPNAVLQTAPLLQLDPGGYVKLRGGPTLGLWSLGKYTATPDYLITAAATIGGYRITGVGSAAGTVAAGNDSRIVNALQSSGNLAGLASASTARQNLGLGASATLNVGTGVGTVAAGNDYRLQNAPQIDGSGNLSFLGGGSVGGFQNGQFISKPYTIQVGDGGATGPVSGASVKVPILATQALTLADMANDRIGLRFFAPAGTDPKSICNGTNDDTAAFAAAAASGRQIFIPAGTCNVSAFSIPSAGGSFSGTGRGGGLTTIKLTTPATGDAFTVNGPGGFLGQSGNWTTVIRDVTFDATGNTAMTGRAIACQNAAGLVLERVQFKGVPNFFSQSGCIFTVALDVMGQDLKAGTGIGFYIDGGSFFGDRLFYDSTKPGGINFDASAYIQVNQTYGVFLGTGIVAHVQRGLYVAPPTGKFAEYSAIGPIQFDQISQAGIELFANGGVIRGWQFNATWAATAATGVYMHVANGGVIYRPELIGVRAMNGMNTNLTANDVTELKVLGGNFSGAGYVFTGICNTASADSSVTIASGFEFNTVMAGRTIVINGANFTIQNVITNAKAGLVPPQGGVPDQAGVPCSFTSGTQTNIAIGGASLSPTLVGVTARLDAYGPGKPGVGIFLDANVDKPILTDNDVTGVPNPLISNRSAPWTEAFIAGNRGADTLTPTIASAATLPLTFARTINLTGTTGVTAISGPSWPGRQVTIIPAAAVTFTAGNNIANSVTTTANVPITATFGNSAWYLK